MPTEYLGSRLGVVNAYPSPGVHQGEHGEEKTRKDSWENKDISNWRLQDQDGL